MQLIKLPVGDTRHDASFHAEAKAGVFLGTYRWRSISE